MRRIARPSSSRSLKVSISLSMTVGASPSDGSSMTRIFGFVTSGAPDREHLLLTARELGAAVALPLGEAREELVDRRVVQLAPPFDAPRAAIFRCSSTVSDGKRRRPCGT